MATTKVPGTMLPAYPYAKRYVATITQATTAAPTELTVLENTFGTMTIARPSTAGIYTWTCTGKFSTTKTMVRFTCMNAAVADARVCAYVITSADVITLQISDVATPTAADSKLFLLEIYSL